MTDQATRVVPAGWYEDPSDAALVRWWNGIAWTDHTQAKPDANANAETAALEAKLSTASLAVRTRRISASTSESWLLGFSPLAFLAAAVGVVLLDLYVVQTPLLWLILLAPYALCVLVAALDARKLRRWGHRSTPAIAWSVLGPLVYLVVRKLKVPGWGQLASFVGIVAALGALYGGIVATGAAAPVELAVKIQTEIRDDLVGSGKLASLACPPIAETTTVGAYYKCGATLPDGSSSEVWVSIDSDDGDYSYSLSLR